MKVFSVRGIKQSGKTTTIEHIIRELSARGYSVGSVKEINSQKFAIDPDPHSNTRRHRLAGAELVCARGLHETDLLFPEKLGIEKILSFYEGEYDWVVMEGVADERIPMIITAHSEADIMEKWTPKTFCVSGRIASKIKEYLGVPAIDATTNVTELVDLLEREVSDRPETFVFRSKRNTVLLRGGVVEKYLATTEAALFEAAVLKRLYAAGVHVPKLITCEGTMIKMRHISGVTLPDFLANLENSQDNPALAKAADRLINWLGDFYHAVNHKITGEIRGDVNGRNFLLDKDRCWGIDFEEQITGEKEQDIGRLIAYVLTYDPPKTPVKVAFADKLQLRAAQIPGIDMAAVCRYRDQELASMAIRRSK